jgi:plasmid stabilization system protein ParE
MKVRWSETALTEIDGIFSYIYENNRTAATAVVNRIERLAALLADFR